MVWSPNPGNIGNYTQLLTPGAYDIPENTPEFRRIIDEARQQYLLNGAPTPTPYTGTIAPGIDSIDPNNPTFQRLQQQQRQFIPKPSNTARVTPNAPALSTAPTGPATTAPQSFQELPMYNLVMGQGAQESWNRNPLNSMLRNPNLSMFGFMAGTPYRLQYGNNFSQDPAERFKNDPGLQMAINEGARGLRNAYASKGLGASGAAAAGLTDYMYKNYTDYTQGQQDLYQREWQKLADLQGNRVAGYINQQNLLSNIYGRYQDQLGNLAGTGMNISNQLGNIGNQMGSGIGSLFGQWDIGAGQQLGNWGMAAGGNIAELLANAGIFDANIWAALGAGMSNNMMQGSLLGAQLANAQNASNAQSLSSMFQGQGAFRGLQ
jgi:hypothetical protein